MTLDGVGKRVRGIWQEARAGHRAGQHTAAFVAMLVSLRCDHLLTPHSAGFVLFAEPVKRKRIPGRRGRGRCPVAGEA
jgi:hypothetical protein